MGLLGGCGKEGPVRYEITGTVLLDNQPVEEGVIYFEPLDGQGSQDGSIITNGEYRIPQDKGLFPGRYKIRIIAGDGAPTSGKGEPLERRKGMRPGMERIPPDYNVKSNVVVEVKADASNRFEFKVPKR